MPLPRRPLSPPKPPLPVIDVAPPPCTEPLGVGGAGAAPDFKGEGEEVASWELRHGETPPPTRDWRVTEAPAGDALLDVDGDAPFAVAAAASRIEGCSGVLAWTDMRRIRRARIGRSVVGSVAAVTTAAVTAAAERISGGSSAIERVRPAPKRPVGGDTFRGSADAGALAPAPPWRDDEGGGGRKHCGHASGLPLRPEPEDPDLSPSAPAASRTGESQRGFCSPSPVERPLLSLPLPLLALARLLLLLAAAAFGLLSRLDSSLGLLSRLDSSFVQRSLVILSDVLLFERAS